MKRAIGIFSLAAVSMGFAATLFWLWYGGSEGLEAISLAQGTLALAATASLCTVNLLIRWFRWHYLIRRHFRSIPARASLRLFFGTLPAFATPLYLGELIRTVLVGRRIPGSFRIAFGVWVTERIGDALTLVAFVLVADARFGLLLCLLGAIALASRLGRGAASATFRAPLQARTLAVLASTSAVAWAMPVAALWWILRDLASPIDLAAAAEVFSLGTLLGALALLPLGSGVTGSSMIVQLADIGVPRELAVAAIAVFRAGTTWYALSLGIVAFLLWRREIVAAASRPSPMRERFDELAPAYAEQIPEAVRERVVGRKVDVMAKWLHDCGARPGWKGLDIGCGPGWYAAEMAKLGYAMNACDQSGGQVEHARDLFASFAAPIGLCAGDARVLPYQSGSFDFAYGVNCLHHITSPSDRARVFDEIVRVLRPGGSFFLHEINTRNPLFAFYMGYLFPLLRDIDDGTEEWLDPEALPEVRGASWQRDKAYLTFLPDFAPSPLLDLLAPVERKLEASKLKTWSAHYVARLVREH